MACRAAGPDSYTVVIIPLRTSLHSLDALRFYLWIKRLKDLEKEKDVLCSGLEVLEKTRLWYLQRLQENKAKKDVVKADCAFGSIYDATSETQSCLIRTLIQRVNGSLGSVMTEPNVTSCSVPSLVDAVVDSDLRWRNTVLTQEVSEKNHQIAMLELEKDALLEELGDLQPH